MVNYVLGKGGHGLTGRVPASVPHNVHGTPQNTTKHQPAQGHLLVFSLKKKIAFVLSFLSCLF